MTDRRKLIEVALPLEAINKASAREKSIRHGHPSTLHLWWARRPLAAARAVIFAQMVDDPSSHPDIFRTEKAQEKERQRLFRIIEELVQWENTTNEEVLERARAEIWQSWRVACADNADHPRAKELFNRHKLPAFHDPFAGGGSLPLEAQRLGLESYGSDLNPVAVLICKAMIEIPPKFAGRAPVGPVSKGAKQASLPAQWRGAAGLAEDVRRYGQWMRDEAEKRIGHLYPKIEVTTEMAKSRPDLKPLMGRKLTVIAWLWARTVKSPNPAFAHVDVPLASTFMLSTKVGKEAYVEPLIEGGGYRFTVNMGKPKNAEGAKNGTKLSRGANFQCLMSGTPVEGDYIKAAGKADRVGVRMMAIVAEGERGRLYVAPTPEMERIARTAKPPWTPDVEISGSTQYLGIKPYGMERFPQLFMDRQLVVLTTLSDLVREARERVKSDALAAGLPDDDRGLDAGGTGATAWAEAVSTFLSMCVSRQANRSSTLNFWDSQGENVQQVFARQALQMTWDFVEGNPFSESTGNFCGQVEYLTKVLEIAVPANSAGFGLQQDAQTQSTSTSKIVCTDPPYYDNVPYADLSDFFYVWLRPSLSVIFPDLFATLAVPKGEELVAFAYRHVDKGGAEAFFLDGMTRAIGRLVGLSHPVFPVTIFYAFRQAETNDDQGTASTGWDTFLDAVIRAGFGIRGTWPMRTEYTSNLKTKRNALASSIVLVCRPRAADAPTATRREFITALKVELPVALTHLQRGNIAPVDLAQAAIGPGMAVYTRYARVLDAEGKPLSVREALALINQTLDEALAEQEGDFDADTRWALAWFEQSGFGEGEYGVAETLSKAKNTSVDGMKAAGILDRKSRVGKVRLLKSSELPTGWDPATDSRNTAWEVVHHLIRALEAGGEGAAAALVGKLGSKAETARELAYRLYTICERKKRAAEALSYNGLVQSWPEITALAREGRPRTEQGHLYELDQS
jgi:putative DNA methylase